MRVVIVVAFLVHLCTAFTYSPLYIQFNASFPTRVSNGIISLLSPFNPTLLASNSTQLPSAGFVLSLGACTNRIPAPPVLSEATQLLSIDISSTLSMLCADGTPLFDSPLTPKTLRDEQRMPQQSEGATWGGEGRLQAALEALQVLGVAFLHPLQPLLPVSLSLDEQFDNGTVQSPYWRARGNYIL
jgi:hypothetical protein